MSDQKRQGWWIPPEIVELVAKGEISPSELVLLATIDYFVSADRGCYASNEYLSERTGLNKTYISDLISKLAEQGLIIRVAFNGRQRALETAWSRMNPDEVESKWLRNRLLTLRREAKSRDDQTSEIPKAAFGETEPDFGNSESSLRRNRKRIRKNKLKDRVEEQKEELSMSDPTGTDGECSDDSSKSNGAEKKKRKRGPQPSPFDKKATDRFHDAISRHITINHKCRMADWRQEFRKLRKHNGVSEDDIKAAINWYAVHMSDDWAPQAHSAKTFREKYVNGQIPAAMKRQANGNDKVNQEQHDIFEQALKEIENEK